MSVKEQELLVEATKQALGEWAFLFWDDEEQKPSESLPYLLSEIEFWNPTTKGKLSFVVPKPWVKVLTANVVGEEVDSVEEDPETVGELANITLGRYLSLAFPPEAQFERNVPLTREVSLKDWQALEGRGAKIIGVEGTLILVYFEKLA